MSEADEIADSLRPMFVAVVNPHNRSTEQARRFVREWLGNEAEQVINNVAASLIRKDKEAEQIRRAKHEVP